MRSSLVFVLLSTVLGCGSYDASTNIVERLSTAVARPLGTVPRLYYLFRAADCFTRQSQIDDLGELASRNALDVIGIMLDPPVRQDEVLALVRAMDARFPVFVDSGGTATAVLKQFSLRPPVAVIGDTIGVRLVASVGQGDRISRVVEVGLLTADQPAGAERTKNTSAPGRRWLSSAVGGSHLYHTDERFALQRPELIAASRRLVFVFDYGDMVLKAFSTLTRQPAWLFDGRRDGIQLINPSDLKVVDDTAVLFDRAQRALFFISPKGELKRQVHLARAVDRIAFSRNGAIYGFDVLGETAAGFRFDGEGRHQSDIAPARRLTRIPFLARESRVTDLPGSDTLISVYRYSSVLAGWYHGKLAWTADGPERVPFPEVLNVTGANGAIAQRVSPRATESSLAVAASEQLIFVLFEGTSEAAGRILDVFSRRTRAYKGSIDLRARATNFAVARGTLFILQLLPGSGQVVLVSRTLGSIGGSP